MVGALSQVAGDSAGTIPDRIFTLLREAIVEGDIPSGSKISEPELARAYGISRGPLREAIGRLEACGLVVRRPNVGARVVSLSSEQLLEIFHVREALEGMAARLAAQHMTNDEIAELRALLEQHGEQIERDTGHAYFQREGDLDFHFRIVQGSHNQRMTGLLCNDLYHVVRLYRYQFGMPSKRGPRAFVEHGYIVDAIERRDPEMAELMMRAHIRASRENVERLLQETENQG
ncbi:MAG: GntR family transcriptional regulator [Gammaproteobacteria bacterium]|nr:GntR family transcriptional regulator [Gammaproteobacteria bacterium]